MKTWRTYREAAGMFLRGATVPTAAPVAVAIGTWLTAINQWEALLAGRIAWVAITLNYLTPFVVASLGFLGARRAKD